MTARSSHFVADDMISLLLANNNVTNLTYWPGGPPQEERSALSTPLLRGPPSPPMLRTSPSPPMLRSPRSPPLLRASLPPGIMERSVRLNLRWRVSSRCKKCEVACLTTSFLQGAGADRHLDEGGGGRGTEVVSTNGLVKINQALCSGCFMLA